MPSKNKKNSINNEKALQNVRKDTQELLVVLEKAHKMKQKLFRDMQSILDKKQVQTLNEKVRKMKGTK